LEPVDLLELRDAHRAPRALEQLLAPTGALTLARKLAEAELEDAGHAGRAAARLDRPVQLCQVIARPEAALEPVGFAARAPDVAALAEYDRPGAERGEQQYANDDLQHIIQPRRGPLVHRETHHREHDAAITGELQLRMSPRAQPLGARALEKAQVVGVVDDAAAVGVLPVDARRPAKHAHRGSSNSCSVAAPRSGGLRPTSR